MHVDLMTTISTRAEPNLENMDKIFQGGMNLLSKADFDIRVDWSFCLLYVDLLIVFI